MVESYKVVRVVNVHILVLILVVWVVNVRDLENVGRGFLRFFACMVVGLDGKKQVSRHSVLDLVMVMRRCTERDV